MSISTRRLLGCGVVLGPVFMGLWLLHALTREGFEPTRHPVSLLSLGDLGWIQIGNFILTGLLYIALAVGVRRAVRPGRGGTWAPILVGVTGLGMIAAGVFVTDAGAGFPPGAPEGAPPSISWHGVLHEVGFFVATLAWLAASFVFARRFAATGHRGWVVLCVAVPLVNLALMMWPDLSSFTVRAIVAFLVQFTFVAALSTRLIRELGPVR